jgi:hypothetical protein
LKNKVIKLKKEEAKTLWLRLGTCSYIRMYIDAVANSVMLYLQHDFYNISFKIKHKLYIASGSDPPPSKEKFWVCAWSAWRGMSVATLRLNGKIYDIWETGNSPHTLIILNSKYKFIAHSYWDIGLCQMSLVTKIRNIV